MANNAEIYLGNVEQKLEQCRDLLKYGRMGPSGNELRDDYGVQQCFSAILETAKHTLAMNQRMYDGNRIDSTADTLASFSGVGYADVSNIQTVGAVDVSIAIKVDSIVPYVAVDRAMANPSDTVYFMNISASNDALEKLGVNTGDEVAPNFRPMNTKVQLNNRIATELYAESVDFTHPLVPGTVYVVLSDGASKKATGRDFNKDGVIYFDSNAVARATVDYTTGVVTFETPTFTPTPGTEDAPVSYVKVMLDSQINPDGSSILKVKPTWVNIQLNTKPHQIILEENAQVAAYMQKIAQQTSRVGSQADYTTLQFDRVVKTYKDEVNRELLYQIWNAANAEIADPTSGAEEIILDLSNYDVTARNETRDDLINGLIIDMTQAFLAKTTMEPTVIVTGSKGAAELARNPNRWVRAPGFNSVLDGLAGTFAGIPVFRHHLLDELDATPTDPENKKVVKYYMCSKKSDNSSGSLVFGEFISLVKTPQSSNYANPFQMSTGFFSQIGSAVIQPNLFQVGTVIKEKN